MFKTLSASWKNRELRHGILFTLLVVLIFRLGAAIPVPFINTDAMLQYFKMFEGTAIGLINTMSGGAFANATLFALGVQPYINASIIIQLLCVAIPALERLAKEDRENGTKKIEHATMIAAVVIGLMQAYGYYVLAAHNGLLASNTAGVWWKAVIIVLSFALGSVGVMMLGKWIDKKGVGNGISILLFAGIVSRLPTSIITTIGNVRAGVLPWWLAVLTYLGVGVIVALIVFVNGAERRIPVHYAARVVGKKSYAGQTTHLPMRVNMGGVMPIIFAQTIATVPATIAAFIGKGDSAWAQTNTWWFAIIYAALIVAFAFYYSSITFDCVEVSKTIKNNGGMIPGFRPGKPTSDLLLSVLNKITLIGALYLGIVAVVPMLISAFVPAVQYTGLSLGGTTVMIAVGVALEVVQVLELKLQTRNYSGLFIEKNKK